MKANKWNYPYPLELIPEWCHLPPDSHNDNVGGCWGISSGKVEETQGKHCEKCEYNVEGANYDP